MFRIRIGIRIGDEVTEDSAEHLEAKQCGIDGNEKPYYKQVDEETFEKAKHKIKQFIEEGLDNDIITKQEYEAMCPEGKQPSKFYCNFKVHKPHEHGTAPPERPIFSGSGSIMENLGGYVAHHILELSTKH